jgi:multiple sugar transport system substrate-binding protein
MVQSSARFRGKLCRLIVLACALVGCTPEKKPAERKTGTPLPESQVHLLVVDDPAMAAAIIGLRAEWKARTGATVSIAEMPTNELIAKDSLPPPVDAVIYPSGQLGLLAARGWIAPLPADYASHQDLAWSDTFELLQVAETHWGQVPYAVPFGSPVLTCYYRTDLFERFHKRPPQTWQEYHELAEFFSRRENLGDAAPPADAPWFGAVEPLAPGWAGRVLLARAAAYAKHRDNFSTLFQIDSMEPLVDGPPFVRALEDLVADNQLGPKNALELDPPAVRREFLAGHAALALSWPGHAGLSGRQPEGTSPATGFAELPGSAKVYNITSKAWESRDPQDDSRVPLLGLTGRLGSVTLQAAQPDNAFQLLAWLSGQEWATVVSGASPATTLYRRSQTRTPRPWVDPLTDTQAAQQYANCVRDALSRQAYLFALRIAGQEKYLAALDAAVEQSASGRKTPAEALHEAAAQWRTITATQGLEAQRKAYRKGLGLEP